jgi:hypothetical protein
MDPTELATRSEAAKAIDRSEPTVSEYVRRGWLDAILIGNRVMVRRASIARLMAVGTGSVTKSVARAKSH